MDAPDSRRPTSPRGLEYATGAWRATFESAAVGMAQVAIGGEVLSCNVALARIVGRSRASIEGTRFLDLVEPSLRQAQVERSRALLAGETEMFRFEGRLAQCGEEGAGSGWVEVSVSLVRDLDDAPRWFVAVMRDVTQQRLELARRELLTQASTVLASTLDLERTLQHVVDLVVPEQADGCAVDLLRPDGTLADFIAVGHREPRTRERLAEMRRQYPPDLQRHLGIARVLRTGETLLVDEIDARILDRLARDARHRELMREVGVRAMLYVPLQVRGDTFGAITLAQTTPGRTFVSEDIEFVEELARRAAGAIDNARLHAESRRAVELRERTLAVVSHDLRNPLQTIGIAQGLLARRLPPETSPQTARQLELIRRSVDQMTRQITDLLDLARVDAGTLSIEPTEHALCALVRRVVERFEAPAREQGITLQCQPGDDEALVVVCDAGRIEQVLANLIGNALKFCTRDDEIRVQIDGSASRDRVKLVVRDTGPGIATELQAQLFEPYKTGDHTRGKGTGLGLFIARQLVVAHDGELHVESAPGQGATFVIELPRSGPAA